MEVAKMSDLELEQFKLEQNAKLQEQEVKEELNQLDHE